MRSAHHQTAPKTPQTTSVTCFQQHHTSHTRTQRARVPCCKMPPAALASPECRLPPALSSTDAGPQTLELHLVHKKLTALPAALASLSSLQVLDVSDNARLSELQLAALPRSLRVLRASGCGLSGALPAALGAHLPCLEQLVVAANRITQADALFACPQLVHASLAYNCVASLSSAAASSSSSSSSSSSRLASLDLAHTDIAAAELPGTLAQLARLPALRALCLQGTPASLLPGYRSAVLQQLPGLMFLDGQRVDSLRAAAATAVEPAAPDAAQQQQQLITLQLELSGLHLSGGGAASPGDTQQHSSDSPPPRAAPPDASPLHPITLHLEFTGPDGSGYCSTALVVQPPAALPPAGGAATGTGAPTTPPAAPLGAAGTPDAKRAGGSSAAPAKGRPGSSVRLSKAAGSAADALAAASKASSQQPTPHVARQPPGTLKLPALQLPASVAVRDFLRSGFKVQLIRTHYEQQQQQQQQQQRTEEGEQPGDGCGATQHAAAADAAAKLEPPRAGRPQSSSSSSSSSSRPASGRPRSKASGESTVSAAGGGAAARPPAAASCVPETPGPAAGMVQVQAVLGTAHIAAPGLLAGAGARLAVVEGVAVFVGEQPLIDSTTHIRLTLAEARAMQQQAPVGSCGFWVALAG